MTEPTTTDSKICLQILHIWASIKMTIEHFAAGHDLTWQQIAVLYQLHTEDHILMGTLAGRLHCDASNVTGMVDRMQAAGLITRESLPGDRRAKQLAITPKGTQLIEQVIPLLPRGLKFASLSTTETQSLCTMLDKLTA